MFTAREITITSSTSINEECIRVAVGLIWVVLVPAEMLGVSSGLGYLILDCRDRLAYGELTSVLLLIGLIGWGLDSALRALGQDGVSSAAY